MRVSDKPQRNERYRCEIAHFDFIFWQNNRTEVDGLSKEAAGNAKRYVEEDPMYFASTSLGFVPSSLASVFLFLFRIPQ